MITMKGMITMKMLIRNIGGATLKKDSAKADLDVMY